jgi:hypothetical protein
VRSPTLLMATLRGRYLGCRPEAEPILVERTSAEVILTLDDGTELRLDATELQQAIESPEPTVGAQARGSRVSTTTVRGSPNGGA